VGLTDVAVVQPDGGRAVLTGAYFALPPEPNPISAPPPVLGGISPSAGPAAGGTLIHLTGTGFQVGSQVFMNGLAAQLNGTPTGTGLAAIAPALAIGPVDVTVVNPDGQQATLAGAFTALAPPPVISTVSPNSGSTAGATTIQILGTGFQAGSLVFIGALAAPVTGTPTATTLTVTTPALPAGPADVIVLNPDGQETVLLGGFSAATAAGPAISAVTPNSGPVAGGAVIQITGTGFEAGSKVFIGGVAAPLSGTPTATTLTVIAPALPDGVADVLVVNPDGQESVLTGGFTAVTGPVIRRVLPNSGPAAGGTVIQVVGTGFEAGSQLFVGGVPAPLIGLATASLLTATVPALSPGPADVMVVNPDGHEIILPGAFNALAPGSVASDNGLIINLTSSHVGSVSIRAGAFATLNVSNVLAAGDIGITVGDSAQALALTDSVSNHLTIASGVGLSDTDTTLITLNGVTVKSDLNLAALGGNNTLFLQNVQVSANLLVSLGQGVNTVIAHNVTVLTGNIDGGKGGNSVFVDLGGNSGFTTSGFSQFIVV
jgi:hypothetical protein